MRNKSNTTSNRSPKSDRGMAAHSAFWDFWGPLILTIGLYSGIRSFIAEARYIPSGSMLPGLQINDRLVVEKITLKRRSPRRGEIVVFNSPYSFNSELIARRSKPLPSSVECALLTFPIVSSIPGIRDQACDAYIKRVIAIGGDHVLIDPKGKVIINGALVSEAYVSNYCSETLDKFNPCKNLNAFVPLSHVLVLGDNRSNSWDSRFWPGSPFLPEREIIGRAMWRFWPINRIGSFSL